MISKISLSKKRKKKRTKIKVQNSVYNKLLFVQKKLHTSALYTWTVPERVYRNPLYKPLMGVGSREKDRGLEWKGELLFFN